MEDDSAVIYGLEFQARALASQVAESDTVRFFVGTQSLKCDNQVHQLEFDEEHNSVVKTVFLHRIGEVWHISASPKQKDVIATCYNKIAEGKCEIRGSVWKLPSDYEKNAIIEDNTSHIQSLELLCDLRVENLSGDTKCVVWQPGDDQWLFSLIDSQIVLWDLQESGDQAKMVNMWSLDSKTQKKFTIGTWNPHQNCSQIATANDTCIRGWDLRSQKQIYYIENAHGTLVRNLDFNPNKQYYLASCGDDCKVKFWDIRNGTQPLQTIDSHSHWVWCVRYNHFHDQLVLTSSSDSRVMLHNVASISSEPFGHLVEDDLNSDNSEDEDVDKAKIMPSVNQDGVISTCGEHEDSVYVVEWSAADPWLYASLSYDGRLIINRVPKAVKYKILL